MRKANKYEEFSFLNASFGGDTLNDKIFISRKLEENQFASQIFTWKLNPQNGSCKNY